MLMPDGRGFKAVPSHLPHSSVDVWFPSGSPLRRVSTKLDSAWPERATNGRQPSRDTSIHPTPHQHPVANDRVSDKLFTCQETLRNQRLRQSSSPATEPALRNPQLCSQKWKSEVLPRQARDALKEAGVPGKILVLRTQLPATSQGRGTRAELESLLVSLRVLKVMEAFPKLWTSSPRLCIS